MFSSKSENSNKIIKYMTKKYGERFAFIGLIKACSVMSSLCKEYPRLNVCMVAPTRQFKSRTSSEMKSIFNKKYYIELGSDFTLHSLSRKYKTKGKIKMFDNKCLMINDGTLLFSSKSKQGKDRLVNGIAELLSDGFYMYDDFRQSFKIEGRCTMIINITLESYRQNKRTLLGNTFLERFLFVFISAQEEEIRLFLSKKRVRLGIKFDDKLFNKLKDYELETDLEKYGNRIVDISSKFSILNYRSRFGMNDCVEALLKAHACLNERTTLNEDDFKFLEMLEPYLIDLTAPKQHKIIKLYLEKWSIGQINDELYNYNNKEYINKVIRIAKDRGVIDIK